MVYQSIASTVCDLGKKPCLKCLKKENSTVTKSEYAIKFPLAITNAGLIVFSFTYHMHVFICNKGLVKPCTLVIETM